MSVSTNCYNMLAILPLVATNPGRLYLHIIRFMNWSHIKRFKKHKAVAHCKDIPNNLTAFRQQWKGVSGIYKITFLPFRMFTYYGSSSDIGTRFKYHYFNGPKQSKKIIFFSVTFLDYFCVYLVGIISQLQ